MKKTIYFSDPKVIEKINNERNKSRYISDLIRADIGHKNNGLSKEEVIDLIMMYMKTNKNATPTPLKSDLESSISSVLDMLD